MNLPQNLPTALAFWGGTGTGSSQWIEAASKQSFRLSYCNIEPKDLAIESRYDRLLPWVVERPTSDLPTDILLFQKDATGYDTVTPKGYADITALITPINFQYDSREFIEFAGSGDINQATSIGVQPLVGIATTSTWADWVENGGLYYIVLVFADGVRLYSQLIQFNDFPEFSETPDNECTSRIRIECVNTCEIGGIPPVVFASQKLFLYYPTSKPEYPFEKSVAVDGNKEEKIIWAKVKKRWKISFYAVETVADFCALLPLYGAIPTGVNITDTYNVQSPVTDVEVEISWPEETNDCLALITISFSREYVNFDGCC